MSEGTSFGKKEEESFDESILKESGNLQGTKISSLEELEDHFYQKKGESKVEEKIQSIENDAIINTNAEEKAEQKEVVIKKEGMVKKNIEKKENLFEQEMNQLIDYQEGDIIKCTVRAVEKNGVFVDFSYKSEGFIASSEFSADETLSHTQMTEVGEELEVMIEKLETKEGYTLLSRKKVEVEAAWEDLKLALKNKTGIEIHVISSVKGGLVGAYQGIRGFIPASQVNENDDDLEAFVDQRLTVAVLQCDRKRKKIIFSHKLLKENSNRIVNTELIESLQVGDIKKGRVTSIKNFGAFVDLGGIEGLIHISELSWSRIGHPSDILNEEEEIEVFVLGVDKDNEKVSLGLKQLSPDPWVGIKKKYEVGQIVQGTVSRIVEFGAFVKLDEYIEGLVHISEITYEHVDKITDQLNVGDTIEAKIKKLIPEEQKIGLSIKEANTAGNSQPVEEIVEQTDTTQDSRPVEEAETQTSTAKDSKPVEAPEAQTSPLEENSVSL